MEVLLFGGSDSNLDNSRYSIRYAFGLSALEGSLTAEFIMQTTVSWTKKKPKAGIDQSFYVIQLMGFIVDVPAYLRACQKQGILLRFFLIPLPSC